MTLLQERFVLPPAYLLLSASCCSLHLLLPAVPLLDRSDNVGERDLGLVADLIYSELAMELIAQFALSVYNR